MVDEIYQREYAKALNLAEAGNIRAAEIILKNLIKQVPDYAPSYRLLGTLATIKRKDGSAGPEDSVENQAILFRKAVELDPDKALYHETLGMHLIQMGEFEECREEFRRAYELNPSLIEESIEELEDLSKKSDHPYYPYSLAFLYSLVGKTDMSNLYREKAFVNNVHVTLFMEGHFDEAELVSREIIKSDVENSGAWMILGNVQLKKELWSDAEASFKKALEIESEYPHAWMGLAIALLHQERFEEAQEADEKAKMYEWNIDR